MDLDITESGCRREKPHRAGKAATTHKVPYINEGEDWDVIESDEEIKKLHTEPTHRETHRNEDEDRHQHRRVGVRGAPLKNTDGEPKPLKTLRDQDHRQLQSHVIGVQLRARRVKDLHSQEKERDQHRNHSEKGVAAAEATEEGDQ